MTFIKSSRNSEGSKWRRGRTSPDVVMGGNLGMGKMPPTYMKSTVSEASSKQHSFKWWQSLFLTYPWLECPRKHRHGCSAVERCLSLVHLQIHSSRIIRSQGTGSTCNLWNTPTATLRVQQYVTGAWGHVARGRITHRNLDTPFCKSVVA